METKKSLQLMKRLLLPILFLILSSSTPLLAQIVVVANKTVKYEDPRWGGEQSLNKGEAITVSYDGGSEYEWWLYPAAFAVLPKKDFHIPGSVRGEKCIVVNGTNVRFREKPSTQSGILCYDIDSGASTYSVNFVQQSHIQRHLKIDGCPVYWDPYYLPKGTRLPYKGKSGNFYKTEFNGMILYISAKYSYVK